MSAFPSLALVVFIAPLIRPVQFLSFDATYNYLYDCLLVCCLSVANIVIRVVYVNGFMVIFMMLSVNCCFAWHDLLLLIIFFRVLLFLLSLICSNLLHKSGAFAYLSAMLR